MTIPLIVLAVLAVVGGWVGIPAALRGPNHFEHFLAPVFAPASAVEGTATASEHAAAGHGSAPAGSENATAEHASATHAGVGTAHGTHDPLEYLLMALSVAIALAGIALAHRMYLANPTLPGRLAARTRGVYQLLYNKYWVDEIYAATVIAGIRGASRFLALFDTYVVDGIVNGMGYLTRGAAWLGGAIDRYLVDGFVNGLAALIRFAGNGVSRLQTGVIQNYVLAVFGGVIALIVIMRFF